MPNLNKVEVIRTLVKTAVESFAQGFKDRHESELNDPEGTINMKVHNVFIAVLGKDIQYYTALVRSFDSSLGNMLESLAMNIASLSYKVEKNVEGVLGADQTTKIAELLEKYKRHNKVPEVSDYLFLKNGAENQMSNVRHDSDYYLLDKEVDKHYLIELKIGGDLDNKKARSEKEAILEQYAILANTLGTDKDITIYFATAYNRFGEGQKWNQSRVKQFFADEELLIGCDFWNFVCKLDNGYEIVLDEYKRNAASIIESLNSIKTTYLG